MMLFNQNTRQRYDDLPYSSYAYPHSAPEQLAVVAALFGLPSRDVGTARILELGCGSGGNLIPVALRHPRSTVVGVDISSVQITEGHKRIHQLALDNISMIEADFLELGPDFPGNFDYIIAHGVYSWVPPEVQETVLGLIERCLAPDGIAFVSYNTYPGWKTKEIIRDAMLMHGGARPTLSEQVAYGRSMLGFLKQTALTGGLTSAALDESMTQVMNAPVDYVAHEYFAPYNQPCYFHQFVDRIGKHRLAYLAEAQPSMMLPSSYSQELAQQLYGALGNDQVRVEQYLDFAVSRVFRQSLLVHAKRAENLSWELDRETLHRLHFAARLSCADGLIKLDGQPQDFVAPPNTGRISVGLSGIKQAIDLLARTWPGTATREELISYAQLTQGSKDAVSSDVLGEAIDELFEKLVLRGMAQVRLEPVEIVPSSHRPVVDPAVQRQIAILSPDRQHVVNAWHDSVEVTDVERFLFPLMDGTRNRDSLVEEVVAAMRDGRLQLSSPVPNDIAVHAATRVTEMLARLVDSAVLHRQVDQ